MLISRCIEVYRDEEKPLLIRNLILCSLIHIRLTVLIFVFKYNAHTYSFCYEMRFFLFAKEREMSETQAFKHTRIRTYDYLTNLQARY
jgi:hypothetical protein